MAKIIYGLSGQGFGHSTRSREIITHLISQGHQVLIFTYGQSLFMLKKDFDVFEIAGFGLSYKHNKLIYWETVYKNAKTIFRESKSFRKSLEEFRKFNPDLVITDFEPLTSILAKLQRVPLFSIDNQHQLTHTKIKVPEKYLADLVIDKFIVRSMVWKADYYLVTSFYQTEPKRKRVFWFPPIVRREVLNLKPIKGDFVLVYLTSNFKSLVEELKKIDQKFVVFGMEIDKKDGNIEFKKFSQDEWLKYLSDCRAIVGNAGLSLMSEALYLKKPYLAIPIKKQIEQAVNAYYLEKLGYGKSAHKFDLKIFNDFMDNLESYDDKLANYPYLDNHLIFDKVDELIKKMA